MIKKIKLTFDKFLVWNAINWPWILIIPPIVLLILLIIYEGMY